MNKTATFSNGHVDTYKGSRPVAAAWMITEKATGKVYASGHSLTREHAEKTARGNVPVRHYGIFSKQNMTIAFIQHLHQRARAAGFKTSEEFLNNCKKENAERAALYAIEVVDL